MTREDREDAIDIIQSTLDKYEEDECLVTEITIGDEDIKAFKMAIEALEQEPVLDKIRSEIQENINYNKKMNYQGIVAGLLLTLAIIDKYKGEMGDT
jgi:hypothetical protein